MLNHITTINPPSFSRAWLTSAHPDLPIIATCFSDKCVRIYSLTSFNLLSTISGAHKRSVRTCSWKPNLKHASVIATGSFDATASIWSNSRLAPAGRTPSPENLDGYGTHDDEDEDDEEEWILIATLDGHESEIKSLSWSAGGNLLATSSRDKSIWIWEEVAEDDYDTIACLNEHQGDVKCVAWHPEEELVASGGYDDDIRLWRDDGDDWGCVEVLRGHLGTVWAIDWEPVAPVPPGEEGDMTNSARLVSCSDDMTIRIWRKEKRDVDGGGGRFRGREYWKEEATLPHTHERAIYSVAWGSGGRILSTGADGRLIVYEERAVGSTPATNGANKSEDDEISISHADENNNQPLSPLQLPNPSGRQTEWSVVAEIEDAHGVFEINHVCWARNADSDVIITTGDDGLIKIWGF
jgi:WD40 repeat protein